MDTGTITGYSLILLFGLAVLGFCAVLTEPITGPVITVALVTGSFICFALNGFKFK